MRRATIILASAVCAAASSPALAEVTQAEDGFFITRAEAVVEATRKDTWLALISPSRWWSSEHTWSADAANLTLMPQAGGCFCEKIPEVEDADRITLEGSVEHMRVIQAYPETALRMEGALGPLQSEPVKGVLTIAISDDAQGRGTRIVWEYAVGGSMRFSTDVISNAVDGVMTLQLSRLSDLLGEVEGPARPAASAPAQQPPANEDVAEDEARMPDGSAIEVDPEALLEGEATEAEEGTGGASAVDDAFGDLSD